jgi:hypothetical protein
LSGQDWPPTGSIRATERVQNKIRDLAISDRAFFFDLSSDEGSDTYRGEFVVRDRILAQADDSALVLGWHNSEDNEELHVVHASHHRLQVLSSINSPNYSFHRHIKPQSTPRMRPAPPPPTLDDDTIYLSFLVSDGDALHWLSSFHGDGLWDSDARGEIPIGWEIQLLLVDLAPAMMEYYFESATPLDSFSASASGIGYFAADSMPQAALENVLTSTKDYMSRTGLDTLLVVGGGDSVGGLAETYSEFAVESDEFLGVQFGFEAPGVSVANHSHPNLTWLPTELAPFTEDDFQTSLARVVSEAGMRSGPLFIPIHLIDHRFNVEHLSDVVDELGPQYTVVRPDHLLRLAREHHRASATN